MKQIYTFIIKNYSHTLINNSKRIYITISILIYPLIINTLTTRHTVNQNCD